MENVFPHDPIFTDSQEDSNQMLTSNVDFDLLFGIPDREINIEVNISKIIKFMRHLNT